MQKDPFLFIKTMRWLEPQERLEPFFKWKHITRQQASIVQMVKNAVNGIGKRKISIRSWKGIGKSSILAMIIIRFLFCYYDSLVPITAPNQTQLYDALRKEISLRLWLLPKEIQALFEKTTNYLRVIERFGTWYARAKTSRKESPEALAGVHSDNMLIVCDEASWIPEEVFEPAKGGMTGENVIFLMIGNPIRTEWYFYNSHNKLKDSFETAVFSSLESPIVNNDYINDIANEYGVDSDEYRYNILGEFPKEDWFDDGGWLPLLHERDLNLTPNAEFEPFRMWIDPSWWGWDQSAFVGRDTFKARVLSLEDKSDTKSIAWRWLTLNTEYHIDEEQTYVDNFWVWANVAQEYAMAGKRVVGINVGNSARDNKRFKNIRAEAYWNLRERIKRWWELVNHPRWQELTRIKYKRDLAGKIQIMPKAEMKKKYGASPDVCDALMLTFIDDDDIAYNNDTFDVDYSASL